MKYIYLFLLVLLFGNSIVSAQALSEKEFALSIDIEKMSRKDGKLFLFYTGLNDEPITDSLDTDKNLVTVKGFVDQPILATIRFVPSKEIGKRIIFTEYDGFNFFLEPGKIKLTVPDTIYKSKVAGSNAQMFYEKMLVHKKPYDIKQRELLTQYASLMKIKDSIGAAKILGQRTLLTEEMKEKVHKPYIVEYGSKTPVTLFVLNQYMGYAEIDYVNVEKLYNKISSKYKSLPIASSIAERIQIAKRTNIGVIAPNFIQNDTLGKPVSLSSFRGKYVLVDFWASWCGPCRTENPNLVKTFHRFKDKGFTVLGVSLDQPGKKNLWLKAIHDDQLDWTHVSDLQYWKNAVAKQYGIKAVPSSLLIDPSGKIIAKNLRGEKLNEKLAEILGN